jgi:hypothetical protein
VQLGRLYGRAFLTISNVVMARPRNWPENKAMTVENGMLKARDWASSGAVAFRTPKMKLAMKSVIIAMRVSHSPNTSAWVEVRDRVHRFCSRMPSAVPIA